LRWFRRLTDYAAELLGLEVPVVLAGDYNVMPTELDVYKPERGGLTMLYFGLR
jgi:exodeoxyribonuclease-3